MPAFLHCLFQDRLFLAHGVDDIVFGDSYHCLRPANEMRYHAYCDDFGPVNMASVIDFVKLVEKEMAQSLECKVVVCVDEGHRSLTNAVFLLGAYLLIRHNLSSDKVANHFAWLHDDLIEPYRDATFSPSDFDLHLIDCWRGLEKGRHRGWIRYAASGHMWGNIDVDEYRHHDSLANGNLHEVVPGKFVALAGPVDLGGAEWRDDAAGSRTFSPSFYAGIFCDMGVQAVVRLNEPQYPADAFSAHGLPVHDLEFPDCTCPAPGVIQRFLRVVDETPGAIAVHCKAGLGRTGTLIAVYLMLGCGFSAREAMGWLRVMRPGVVLGPQQRYLCSIEVAILSARSRRASIPHPLVDLILAVTNTDDAAASLPLTPCGEVPVGPQIDPAVFNTKLDGPGPSGVEDGIFGESVDSVCARQAANAQAPGVRPPSIPAVTDGACGGGLARPWFFSPAFATAFNGLGAALGRGQAESRGVGRGAACAIFAGEAVACGPGPGSTELAAQVESGMRRRAAAAARICLSAAAEVPTKR
jgi:cell division cycle 14